MKTLTFAFDTQLNDHEDWIKEGTKVSLSDNEYHLKRYEDFAPVIITEAYDIDGIKVNLTPYVEWFSVRTFKELR